VRVSILMESARDTKRAGARVKTCVRDRVREREEKEGRKRKRPERVEASISAPLCNRSRAMASCLFCSARYSGVMPVRCVRMCVSM